MRLDVSVEVCGTFERIGQIETLPGSGEVFAYDERWVEEHPGWPLSLSLPIRRERFEKREIRPYFEGLLPEEDARKAIARQIGVSSSSYLKLLRSLGSECIGAVRITDMDDEADSVIPSYAIVGLDSLAQIAEGGYQATASLARQSRLSIAGAQAKTGLYFDTLGGEWYLPKGLAPSTHVIKPENDLFFGLVDNERWCMGLAQECGIVCAHAFEITTPVPLLAIERYDRVFTDDPTLVDNLPVPLRLHQEDLCQALGVRTADKYEERGRQYLPAVFDIIRSHSTDPLEDQERLIDLLAFNCVIGNCDAHLKNYGLMRSGDWRELRLAPAYDLVSTAVYKNLTRVMGMGIGQAHTLDDVSASSFEEMARQVSIAPRLVVGRLRNLVERVHEALRDYPCQTEIEQRCREQCRRGIERMSS